MAAKALFVSGVVLAALFRCGWLEAADLLVKLRVQTNVPPRTVGAAKEVAAAVLRDIGVTIAWTTGDSPDEHDTHMPWRRIVVIDQPTAAYSGALANEQVLGVSPRSLDEPGRVGVFFYKRVLRTSREARMRSGSLLGYAIAPRDRTPVVACRARRNGFDGRLVVGCRPTSHRNRSARIRPAVRCTDSQPTRRSEEPLMRCQLARSVPGGRYGA